MHQNGHSAYLVAKLGDKVQVGGNMSSIAERGLKVVQEYMDRTGDYQPEAESALCAFLGAGGSAGPAVWR